jgi:dihydroorotase
MADQFVIRRGSVVHPASIEVADVLVRDGMIAEIGIDLKVPRGTLEIEADGCFVGPGLVDLHAHLREPGGEEAETVSTGAMAAALGGYSAVVAMPNTTPAIDCAAVVAQVLALGRATPIDVAVAGAITVGRAGANLAPMAEMASLGVTMFTDDGTGVQDAGLMLRAMEYAAGLGVTLAEHCEDESLAAGGCMNDGALSARLGLPGRSGLAEEVMVARDLALAEATGCSLHLLHLSTARSVALLEEARARGVDVTAEVAPHHLHLTEECCASYDPIFKVHPPLRSSDDVATLRVALVGGVLDAVATDHAPHPPETKDRPFDEASPGMLGLQQAAALTLEALGDEDADPIRFFEVLSRTPARIAKLRHEDLRLGGHSAQGGAVAVGEVANLCVIDPAARPVVKGAALASRASNTPYEGRTMHGAVRHTVARGHVVVLDGELVTR